MKTYLFDTLNRFRRFSENLDVKATLCNKPWQVFNDSGEKELYIFQEDGTLLITYSGRVTHSTWQYIAANKSIVISAGEQSYMVHPAFMDNVLFALQVDGTNECAFLIDENNSQGFAPQNYTALMGYFEEKERRLLEEDNSLQVSKEEIEDSDSLLESRIAFWYCDNIECCYGCYASPVLIPIFILDFVNHELAENLSLLLILGWGAIAYIITSIIEINRLKRYIRTHPIDKKIKLLVKHHNDNHFYWERIDLKDFMNSEL